MHVGVVLPQTDWPEVLEAASHAEQAGADSVWVVDHFLGFPPERGILEAWADTQGDAGGSRALYL